MALYRAGKFHKAQLLQNKIAVIEEQIKEAEAYEPRKLSELLDRATLDKYKISQKMVALHLAADFLADCGYDLKDTLGKLGLDGCSMLPMIDEITKKAQAFASIVCHPEFAGLSDFMVNNEEYIDKMHAETNSYIDKKLNIA